MKRQSVMTKRTRKEGDAMYAGIITALAVVGLHDQETIFREIVATCDESELINFARRDGSMKFSYLSKYGYGKKA